MKQTYSILALTLAALLGAASQAAIVSDINNNQPQREEWLKDAGFGMFVHWNVDSQLGVVISHSLVGASPDYFERYINELPKSFDPVDWNPRKIVALAKNAGMKYIVFTTKHHSGFCFWDTKTTDFNIANTPYGKDLLKEFVAVCREAGLAVGFYYSSEDFVYTYRQGVKDVRRVGHWEAAKAIQPQYAKFIADQTRELMTQYGQVDMFFLDSPVQLEEVKALVWEIQPSCLITRGAIATPEQFIPGETIGQAWESNMTMGTQWAHKPTNEIYKSGTYLINALIEARAKGGAFLLNIGPDQWGAINEAQQGRLTEIAAWNFVNHEAVQNVRSWIVSNEGDTWLTHSKDGKTVYAYLTNQGVWPRSERRDFTLHSVKATPKTAISVLGQTGNLIEYFADVDGTARFQQTDRGLTLSVVRAQRLYNNHRWPNPIVVKLENVEPALEPARFLTAEILFAKDGAATFGADLSALPAGHAYKLGFEYRPQQSSLKPVDHAPWTPTGIIDVSQPIRYTITELDPSFSGYQLTAPVESDSIVDSEKPVNASLTKEGIEYRAVLYQGLLRIDGNVRKVSK